MNDTKLRAKTLNIVSNVVFEAFNIQTVLIESKGPSIAVSCEGIDETKSNGWVVPIKHPDSSKVDFGAEVYGIDLNSFTDSNFELIHDALHKHKLIVFKEQPAMLEPQQQYRLTSR